MKQRQQNLIIINGRTYDARTGMVVPTTPAAAQTPLKKVMADIAPSGPQAKHLPNASLVQRKSSGEVVTQQSIHASTAPTRHHVAAKKVHRNLQKTNTLRRTGLQRPHMDVANRPQPGTPSAEAHRLAARQARAAATPRPAQIQKFHPTTVAQPAASQPAPTPIVANRPNVALAQLQSQHLASKPAPKVQAVSGPELKEQLIKARLAEQAEAPEDKFHAQQHRVNRFFAKQPKLLSAVLGMLCVLVLIGYITYLNMPGISMRLAASRAGFAATMPSYKPSGYSLNGLVASAPGQVNLTFTSNTNDDSFSLRQKESNWDSQALLENHVSKKTGNYLTYQEKGLTIFMYDGKADWVNGGVWYSVDGTAGLSSDQILKLAASM